MKVRFSDAAEAEIEEAIDYYNPQQAVLGIKFLQQLNNTVQRIVEFPDAWTRVFHAELVGVL